MAKQMRIVGTERKDINKDIENLAQDYVTKRDAHGEATKALVTAKEALTAGMKGAKLAEYLCDFDSVRVIFEKEMVSNVKVKKVEIESEEDESEDGDK